MRTVQISDDLHAELTQRKTQAGASRLDTVIADLLHPTPRKAAVTTVLRRLGPALRAMGVEQVRLFGSVVHDQGRPGSDIDLILDLAPGKTYFDLARIQDVLEQVFQGKADVVLPDALHPRLKDAILHEAEVIPLA